MSFESPEKRHIPMDGIHNFRDYGGYRVFGGGRLVEGQLYRSGDHSNATEADLDRVIDLELAAIFDLRGTSERLEAPCKRSKNCSAKIYLPEGETAKFAPHIEVITAAKHSDDFHRDMIARYTDIPFRPYLILAYRQFFQTMPDVIGPTLVYCSAGKDRTGVLVALLQLLMGVHKDDVMADYLLTNTLGGQEERIAALRDGLEKLFGENLSDEAIRVVMGVDPEFLDAALRSIIDRYGTIEEYAVKVLKITPALHKKIAERLIVDQ